MENPYPAAWAALIGVGAALEVSALLRKKGPSTLSSNVWRVLDFIGAQNKTVGYMARGAVLTGLTLLGVHLAFQWPR
jgi:hypothetical protein